MSERPCPPRIPNPCKPKSEIESETESRSEKRVEKKVDTKTSKPVCREFWSPGFDARFPNQNQTRRCWVNYVDYIRCQAKFGTDHEPCEYFKKTYQYLCPNFWIENWDEQKENGTFPMPRWA